MAKVLLLHACGHHCHTHMRVLINVHMYVCVHKRQLDAFESAEIFRRLKFGFVFEKSQFFTCQNSQLIAACALPSQP